MYLISISPCTLSKVAVSGESKPSFRKPVCALENDCELTNPVDGNR